MTAKDFALVVVRLFGLWVLFECIDSGVRLVASTLLLQNQVPEYSRLIVFANLFDFLLRATIGFLLAWKPQIVVNRLHVEVGKEAELRLSATNLIFVCFSVAGLVFLLIGLTGLVYHASTWAFAPTGDFYEKKIDRAGIVTSAFQALAGLWLLCRFRRILRWLRGLLRTIRAFGAPKVEDESSNEKQKL